MHNEFPNLHFCNYRYTVSPRSPSPTLVAREKSPVNQNQDILTPHPTTQQELIQTGSRQETLVQPQPLKPTSISVLSHWHRRGLRAMANAKNITQLKLQITKCRASWNRFRFDATSPLQASMCANEVMKHAIFRMQDLLEDNFTNWSDLFSIAHTFSSWTVYLESSASNLDWFDPFLSIWDRQTDNITDPKKMFSRFDAFNAHWRENAHNTGLKSHMRDAMLSLAWTKIYETGYTPTLTELKDWSSHCIEATGYLPPKELCGIFQLRCYANFSVLSYNHILTFIYQLPTFWHHPNIYLPSINIIQSEIYHAFAGWIIEIPRQLTSESSKHKESIRIHLNALLKKLNNRSYDFFSMPNENEFWDLSTTFPPIKSADIELLEESIRNAINKIR